MQKHSISIRGHQTSYSLEEPFWQGLKQIARKQNIPLARLVTRIDANRQENENLSSAIRLYLFEAAKRGHLD